MRSRRTSERCEQTSERMSEWPIFNIPISRGSESLWIDRVRFESMHIMHCVLQTKLSKAFSFNSYLISFAKLPVLIWAIRAKCWIKVTADCDGAEQTMGSIETTKFLSARTWTLFHKAEGMSYSQYRWKKYDEMNWRRYLHIDVTILTRDSRIWDLWCFKRWLKCPKIW